MRSLKITLFFVLAFQSYMLKAQYSQGFEPVSGTTASIITILRNECWNINGLSVNAGGVTPINGTQSFVTGTSATLANRGFITPYMSFDGSDSLAINYKYYGTPGNFQRWFLVKLISDLGQVTTIDSVFINTSNNAIINFNKTITGLTGKFKVFINYRGTGNGINGSRTGFDSFFFNGNYFYATGCVDTDIDGVVDIRDADDDNDGIPDVVEVCGVGATSFACLGATPLTSNPPRDADGDGIENYLDSDFCTLNANGVCTSLDFDGDGIPNHLDLDSDNDGIPDALEANGGIPPTNYLNGTINSPVGTNGMPNSAETATNSAVTNFPLTNTDGVSNPDYLDIDADNDGIVDNIEAQGTFTYVAPLGTDNDRDGVDDAYDNQAGLFATGLTVVNTDNTDNPDYIDTDSDNDGRNDIIEAYDSNGNNIQDGTELSFTASGNDADNDGLDNNYDLVIGLNASNGGQTPNNFPNAQFGTAEKDWREAPFVQELCNNGIDDDGDGFTDCLDPDCGLPIIDSLDITNAGPCTNVSNGSITVFSANASAYSIDNGANFSIDSLFTNLPVGLYNIVIQNSNGCTVAASNNPIEITSINCAPIAVDDNFNTNQNTTLNGTSLITNDDITDGPGLNINTVALNGPGNGSLTINADGTFIYIPTIGFFGNDQFEYVICDGATPELCDTGLVTITVNQINQLPVINNEFFSTNINTPVNGNILLNDTDPDGTLSVTVLPVVDASNGIFITDNTGNFTYTPNNGFTGLDTIVVLVCDNSGACQNDTLFITTINNIPPLVSNESLTIDEDNIASGNILLNDSDIDGTISATVIPAVNPANGIFTITPAGDFVYTPNLNFNGIDTVVIAVCDNLGACVNDTIFISITPVNDLPVVISESFNAQLNTSLNGNILINDSDIEGPLTVTISPLFAPLNGIITMAPNGDFTYTPNNGFFGVDLMWFSVCDNNGACVNDTIFITVTNTNIPPTVNNESIVTNEDTQVSGNILNNDSDVDGTLSVNITPVVTTSNGVIFVNSNGDFTYTPDPNFFGTDFAIFEVCDNANACVNDTIFINVNSVNDAPIVTNDFYSLPGNTALTDNFTLNDNDVDGNLIITLLPVQDVSNGILIYDNLGGFTYTPSIGFVGADTAIIQICDNGGICISDTLFFDVTPPSTLPVILNDFYTLNEDASLNNNFLNNDFSNQGAFTTTLVSGTNNGSFTLLPNGFFSYVPNPNFNGLDTAIVLVCDVNNVCLNDTLFFTIVSIIDPMVINNESYLIVTNTSLTDNILTNDIDIEGTLSVTLPQVFGPSNGNISINVDGSFTYTPNNGFDGTDTIIVQVCSTIGTCENDTIIIDVHPSNNPPTVINETFITAEDTPLSGNILSNDSDIEGPVTIIGPPVITIPFGSFIIDIAGNFTFTPNLNYFGSFEVIIPVCDNSNTCVNDTITITVTPVNDLPTVLNETITTTINVAVSDNLLANDADIEGPLTANIIPINGPNNGSIILTSNGDFTYTPNFNFFGTDTIVISVCDNDNFCVNDTIFITIPVGNTFPVVENETFNTIQDQIFVGNILTNDFDLETGLVVNITPIVDLANGLISMSANGAFSYSPNAGFVGNDFVVFSVCDLDGACVNDTVFFIVSPVPNITPDVFNDFYTLSQDASITDNLMLNDSDPDGTITTNTSPILNPLNGSIIILANGDFTYTPNAGFIGNDTVVVQVCDNSLACVNDTLFFTVNAINNLPTVVNDTITIQEDNNAISNILLNDSDIDGPVTASLIIILNPVHGTVNINASGNYAYSPDNNFNGNDTIVFSVCDSDNNCINDTLFITVLAVNDNIVVANENFSTNENTAFSGSIIVNDNDPDNTAIIVNTTAVVLPSNGTVLINSNGTFDYLPNAGFIGIDTIVVNICDSGFPLPASCANDTIFITVIDINNPPIVFNENVTTDEDVIISGTVITIDNDPDGTALITNTIPVAGPSNGTIILNPNGDFTYTPNSNFNGNDTIVVQICDSGLPLPAACSFDTIYVTINTINDAPTVVNDTASALSNQTASGNILLNDSDIENTTLSSDSINIVGPSNGTIVINSNGDFIYTPNTGYYGQDTIYINVCDSGMPLPAICVIDTLIITINPIPAIANAGLDQTICSDSIVLNGNPTPVGDGLWTSISGTATFADSSLFNSSVYNLSIGQNILVWSISSNTGLTTDTVIINVTPPLAQPNAGADKTICSFSDTLNAIAPAIGNGIWTVIGGSGIINDINVPNTPVTSLGIGNNVFVWTVSNAICPSVSDTVVLSVTPSPSNAAAGTDLQICGTSIQLNANAPITGVGYWKKINTATTINDTLNAQTLVFDLSAGANEFVWVIENGICPVNTDTVVIFTFQNSTLPLAGNDTTICQNQMTLNANTIDIGIGQWGIVTSTGSISDFNINNAVITNLNEGENIIVWTSVNGVCPIQSDTIIIQFQTCPDTTVFIPEGFSPNNDGTNDVFIISGTGGKNISVQIFNRWGSKVYENNNYQNDWGGNNEDSKELLDATYYYIIKVDGEDKARTGYITIWR